jgi:L-amino acid N-acyltransferase YncA
MGGAEATDGVVIRAATEADLGAIRAIYNHAVLHSTCTADYEPRGEAAQREWFTVRTSGGYPVLVADSGGEVLGWSALGPYHARVGYRFTAEDSVYIAPDRQGRGLGLRLLGPLIEAAGRMGLHAVIGGIDSGNVASLRLHARLGFVEVGRFREVITKFDRWLDVVYVQRLL